MAVLRLGAVDQTHASAPGAQIDLPSGKTATGKTLRTLHSIAVQTLPPDVIECETTFILCFRASQMLNFLSGGKPEMTFSARIWRARYTSRSPMVRLCWLLTVLLVDGACAVMRGERGHCAMAWVNYVRRPGRARELQLR